MDPNTFATAYALTGAAGIRPFLTLALASVAMHYGYLHPAHAFAYLGSDGATAVLAVLAVIEFVGDKIPVVDHTFHVLHFGTKPIAAALIVGSALSNPGMPDAVTDVLMTLGALNALGVHAGIATVRAASTTTTFGVANPFVSLAEDLASAGAVLLAILLPVAGALCALAVTLAIVFIARRVYLAMRATSASSAMAR